MNDNEQDATAGVANGQAVKPQEKSALGMISDWLHSTGSFAPIDYMAEAIRDATLDWLAGQLAVASRAPFSIAKAALNNAIPVSERHVLDGGETFIFAVDQAAMMLGCDPETVSLRPTTLHS